MPPRQKKSVPIKETPVSETPIIYFLKVSKEAQKDPATHDIPEAYSVQEYSQILKEEAVQQQFDETVIHSIVSKIHLQTEYPPNTACFWCCHPFDWKAIVLPTHYDVYSNQYTAEGHYCSPECALGGCYGDPLLTDSQRWLRQSLLKAVYAGMYPPNTDIHPAPDRRALRLFGGTLNIDQYRRYVKEGGTPLKIAMPPIRLYMPSINTQATARDIRSYVALSSETVDKASQQLRLKRTKPVHANIQTLDKCMGLGTSH
jgi:hypothetical protein